MAKNYAALYDSKNDSSGLEQSFFIVAESDRGTLAIPAGADYLDSLGGGSIEYNQPFESSPQRSGRHNYSIIKDKKALSWSIPMFINIDTTLGAPTSNAIDPSVRLLWRSALGHEVLTGGAHYDSSTEPSVTFSIHEVGDRWAKQASGCFVDDFELALPGDGRSQVTFSGRGSEAKLVGIARSVTANVANTITVEAGEGYRLPLGARVMIIKADGVTRSADTPIGTARVVTNVVGNVVQLSGAPLADADGSAAGAPIYVCYYEPATKTAISNPQTGLQGFVEIQGLEEQCIRSITIRGANNHEINDYCFGYDRAHGGIFAAAGRLEIGVSIEMNLNAAVVEFFNTVQEFDAKNIRVVLGDETKRFLQVVLPRVYFPVPTISVPETGSIPITFEGSAYQTGLDAANEITVSFI